MIKEEGSGELTGSVLGTSPSIYTVGFLLHCHVRKGPPRYTGALGPLSVVGQTLVVSGHRTHYYGGTTF